MEKEDWYGKDFAFFCNKKCERFPCHTVENEDNFNCLFCYCPLYWLEEKCGGGFSYLMSGIKDCSKCTIPHEKENYGQVTEKLIEWMRERLKY